MLNLKEDIMNAMKEAELSTRCEETEKINTKRFVESFFSHEPLKVVPEINHYAEKYNLKIISVSADKDLCGAIVVFEGNKPMGGW